MLYCDNFFNCKKALDTFGNFQRPVFALGVSQNTSLHIKTISENLRSIGHRSCKKIMEPFPTMFYTDQQLFIKH